MKGEAKERQVGFVSRGRRVERCTFSSPFTSNDECTYTQLVLASMARPSSVSSAGRGGLKKGGGVSGVLVCSYNFNRKVNRLLEY